MLKKLWQSKLLAIFLGSAFVFHVIEPAYAEATIYEDDLTTTRGLRWGAPGLPYKQAADIKDSLVDAVVGKVAPDRHGIGSSIGSGGLLGGLFGGPFSSPSPGRLVFVSLWGSKVEGCFVEMIIQYAPAQGEVNLEGMVPKLLEVGVAGQLIALPPQPNAKPRGESQGYSYTVSKNGQNQEVSSTWYMTRNLFVVDSNIANILRNAPDKKVRVRLTLANGNTVIVPIGEGTVKKWQEAYSFNPKCTNLNQVQTPDKPTQSQQTSSSALTKPARSRSTSAPSIKPSRRNSGG